MPAVTRPNTIEDVLDRLVQHGRCWLWAGGTDSKGYGSVSIQGRICSTHIVVYEHFFGPVPEGRELDHLCRRRACANPTHLEPVTHAENVRRGDSVKDTAACGHPFDMTDNAKTGQGRRCRTCRNAYIRKWYAERKKSL